MWHRLVKLQFGANFDINISEIFIVLDMIVNIDEIVTVTCQFKQNFSSKIWKMVPMPRPKTQGWVCGVWQGRNTSLKSLE